MSRLRATRWLLSAALAVGACGPTAPPAGQGGLAVQLHLPGPIVPAGARIDPALLPVQDGLDVATLGTVLVEIRSGGEVVAWQMVPESENGVNLFDIPPDDYTITVQAGLPADERNIGIIRFDARGSFTLEPDEVAIVELVLTLCDPETLARCDPDFGTERSAPPVPEVYELPARTGCEDYFAAGTKPTGATLRDNTRERIGDGEPFWALNLGNDIADEDEAQTISLQLKAAWLDEPENVSERFEPVEFGYAPGVLCWNPYRPTAGATPPAVEQTGTGYTIRWQENDRTGNLALIVQEASRSVDRIVSTPPNVGGAVLARTDAVVTDRTLDFADPATDAWTALLYVDHGSNWQLEGAFEFDADWAAAVGHEGF